MPTTVNGDLHGFDTKDSCEFTRLARKYDYQVSASDGGTVRLKISYWIPPVLGIGPEYQPGKWKTLVSRFKTESGQTTSGSFTLPDAGGQGSTLMKLIFSRGVATQGVDYEFYMEPN